MPFLIPLVAAGVGAAATTGVVVAGVAISAEVIAGVMIAGGVLSSVGMLTHNKTLMMIGGIVGLAGGVAGLAGGMQSASASIAEAANTAGGTATQALNVTPVLDGEIGGAAAGLAGDAGSTAATGASNAASAGGDALEAANAAAAPLADTAPVAATANPGGIVNDAMSPAPIDAALPEAAATGPLTPTPEPVAAADPYANETAKFARQDAADPGSLLKPAEPTTLERIQNVGKDAMNWMKNSKQATNLAGGIINGAAKSYGDQSLLNQKYKLDEEAAARQRARISASIKGLQMPVYQRPGA